MEKNIEQVTHWILKYHPEIHDLPVDTDLIDSRLVDSLRFMELVFLLEQLSGKNIDTTKLNIDDLRTLDRIEKNFLN